MVNLVHLKKIRLTPCRFELPRNLGSISPTCLHTAIMGTNPLALNFYFTNIYGPNSSIGSNDNLCSTFAP